MDTRQKHGREESVAYPHWGYRLLLSLVISHLIVTEGQAKSAWLIILQCNYYLAMLFSVAVSVLVMWLVHAMTKKLDQWAPWTEKLVWRILLQFLLGICLILFLIYLLVRVYFWWFEKDFYSSGYLEVEFPIAKWMVLCMNLVYIGCFYAENFVRSKRENDKLTGELLGFYEMTERQQGYQQKLEAKLGNKVLQVSPEEVVCFEREENVGYVWMVDGRKYNIDYKMQELAGLLDPKLFYQISRSVMFSMAAVKGYEKVKNSQGRLILKDNITADVPLLVSRHRFEGFKKVLAHHLAG